RIEVSVVDTTYRAIALWPEIGGWVGNRRRSGRTVIGSRARPAAPRSPAGQATQGPGQTAFPPSDQGTLIAPRPGRAPPPPPLPPPPRAPPARAPGCPRRRGPPAAAGRSPARRRNTWIAAAVLLLILGAGGGYYGYTEGWWLRSDVEPAPPAPGPIA